MDRGAQAYHDAYFGGAPRAAEMHPAREYVEEVLGDYAPDADELANIGEFAQVLHDLPDEVCGGEPPVAERPTVEQIAEYLHMKYEAP